MGRPRKPTAVKERDGSFVKNPQRRPKNEPQPTQARPRLPVSLHGDKFAQTCWHKCLDLLDDLGIMTVTDVFLVELFAMNYSKFRQANKIWTKEGFTVVDDNGCERRHPISFDWHKLADRSERLMTKMGFTPIDRSKLIAEIDGEDDDLLMQFLEANQRN